MRHWRTQWNVATAYRGGKIGSVHEDDIARPLPCGGFSKDRASSSGECSRCGGEDGSTVHRHAFQDLIAHCHSS